MDEETDSGKMWDNFIIHFRKSHQELRDTDMSISELGYQSANAIVEQIFERLQEEEENVTPYPSKIRTPSRI